MSGFVGWIDFQRDLNLAVELLDRMTDTMCRRGPNAKGTWVSRHATLGHRDLRSGDTGLASQPIAIEVQGEPVVLAYDGEVYNLDALRREIEKSGASIEIGSAPEILLRLFLLFGRDFVDRLDGQFAFSIWDGRNRELILGRDRLGFKPLYYFEYPDGILFASEPKGIMANPLFESRLDFSALPILLQPRIALPGETPLLGLREVPRAHVLSFSRSGLSLRRYWHLTSKPHHETFDETVLHVRSLLEDVVKRQVSSNMPPGAIGAMLSGGIDSTSVTALAMRALKDESPGRCLDSFCIRFDNDATHFVPTELRPDVDAPYAAEAANFIGSRHRTVTVSAQGVLDAIPDTRRARDLPGWGQFDGSTYLLFREMRKHCAVAVTGEVADELFGGYPYFFSPALLQRENFPWLEDSPKLSRFLCPDLVSKVDPEADEVARYRQWIADVPKLSGEDPENARMREIFYLTMSGRLSVLLDRMDRMSMAVGLEMRLPFCDHRLLEYVWNVPWSMKSSGGIKGLLKAAMADALPVSTLTRKKSAYPHIQNRDYDEGLLNEASSIVNDKCSPIAELFDSTRLNGLITQIRADQAGLNAAHILIQLVEMRAWVDDYRVSFR
jgi:asparagine synthase (glutamine-hydrolysing)/putative beta-lactam synthetase